MNYRSILVHLDESARCQARVALAASLALAQGAHLLGLAPTGLVNLPPALKPTLVGGVDLATKAREQMKKRATELVNRFKDQVATLGLVSHEGRVHDDDTLSAVLQHARASDLVVLGQNDPKHFTPLVSWDFPQQVFLHSGRPVQMGARPVIPAPASPPPQCPCCHQPMRLVCTFLAPYRRRGPPRTGPSSFASLRA